MRQSRLQHQFVEFIPEKIEEGVLYISVEYRTMTHKCCCGCGAEVVTPLGPTDWRLIFDGKSVSIEPSVGSWSLPCRSHYWISNGQVRWAEAWSKSQVQSGRESDARVKRAYFAREAEQTAAVPRKIEMAKPGPTPTWWERVLRALQRK